MLAATPPAHSAAAETSSKEWAAHGWPELTMS